MNEVLKYTSHSKKKSFFTKLKRLYNHDKYKINEYEIEEYIKDINRIIEDNMDIIKMVEYVINFERDNRN